MTREEIVSKVLEIDRTLKYDEEKEIFVTFSGREIPCDWEDVEEINNKLKKYEKTENTIQKNDYYEILATSSNSRIFFIDDAYEVDNGEYQISVGEISDEFAMYLLPKLERRNIRILSAAHRRLPEENELTLLNVIKSYFRSYLSIKITSLNDDIENANTLVNSYIFNLAYKRDRYLTINSALNDYFPIKHFSGRGDMSLDFPRKSYDETLTKYYLHASSMIVESTKYLMYYNVLEYNFVDIYEEDICKKMQNIVTSPDFSYKNVQHYKKLLKEIPKNYKKNNTIDELDALKLTIKKYVNIDEFKLFINRQGYKFNVDNLLSRAKKDIIDINDSEEQIISQIANRVYSIRNAIVHSKNDGVNVNYMPLKHDKFLEDEIPLVKYLAECVIINSGKLI